ncbi:inovirus Gp2 family protein [Burkholderia sp. Bp9140]|uniref:inovirus Gp2 family protein n=1 Tax=Burkholderia sp. Bp9140 TaxID=2184572 RepID=UPI0021AB3A70|nr:inovirus Gp2 family protein [Burkholderia sp. Bp9140]
MTLTFSNDTSFCARHISDFLARVRQGLKRRGHALPYAWVLERGGRLHYHLMLWLPRDFSLNKAKLTEWWPWGATWTACCKQVKRWGRYMAKFKCMAHLPKAARLFGCGGLDERGKAAVQHAGLPRWLQALVSRGTSLRRCSGGGWVNTETGEIHLSPYRWTPRGWAMRDEAVSAGTPGEELCEAR